MSKTLFYFSLLILIGGLFWRQMAVVRDAQAEVQRYYEQKISFEGIVVGEPAENIGQIKYEMTTADIPGKVLVSSKLYPKYKYGDRLKIAGTIKEPVKFESFDYHQYLAQNGIYSAVYSPQIDLISEGGGLKRSLFNFKKRLKNNLEKVFLPPQGGILKAVLLGDKSGLSDKWKEKLSRTGTSHIVAISGMHMVIISEILLFLFLAVGFWRKQVFYLVLILLAAYIIMIGAPASAVRAGIMIGLLLLAQQTSRLRNAGRAVFLAAAAMLLFNPLLLAFDAGFQLSFAAVLSVIYLKPIFDSWLEKIPNPFSLKDILTLTLAAQTGVLPILIWHFNQISLISPLANILVVPLLPVLMVGGLAVAFAPVKILAYPLWLLLGLILKAIDFLSRAPVWEIQSFSWFWAAVWYAGLFLIVGKSRKKISSCP